MAKQTLTLKFGPQNQYALTIPVEDAAHAELVIDVDDMINAANMQAAASGPEQKQFEWMAANERQ